MKEIIRGRNPPSMGSNDFLPWLILQMLITPFNVEKISQSI